MSAFPPVAELVPHAAPMILVDEVVASDEASVTTRVRLTEHNVFCENGRIPAVLMLEHMAQTIAVFAGLAGHARGEPPQVGFLVACRQASFEVDWLAPGEELIVKSTRTWGELALGNFECEVTRDGKTLARANLSVYRGNLEGMAFE